MKNYNIEGGIDFFSELYKSLDINENEEEDNNKCLITNELLTDKYVSLNCGHKFNYLPLYYDLVNHKNKFNFMEGNNGRLNLNEIRCPYCRKKQIGLLPYYEELGLQQINGVNFYDPNIKEKQIYKYHKCQYNCLNPNYDETLPESALNNKYLNNINCIYSGTQISLYNQNNPSQPITFGDTNYYCYSHKKLMIKQYKAQEKEKEKIAKKQAKELEKASIKEAKEKLKLIQKAEKQKLKEEIKKSNKKIEAENVVLGPSIINNHYETVGCIQTLKTGLNKGKICGCKVFSENMCKRHFSLNNKE